MQYMYMFNLQDLDKIIVTSKIKVLILQRRQENKQVCRQLCNTTFFRWGNFWVEKYALLRATKIKLLVS